MRKNTGVDFESNGIDSRLCIALMIYISDEMEREGILGEVDEFRQRYKRVLDERDCPLAVICAKYRQTQAIDSSAKQLSLFDLFES